MEKQSLPYIAVVSQVSRGKKQQSSTSKICMVLLLIFYHYMCKITKNIKIETQEYF